MDATAAASIHIAVKRYERSRLYDTSTGRYVTVDELRNRQRKRVDFVVHDTETDMNLTRVSLV